jgi:endo-1,4-beta-xylanase
MKAVISLILGMAILGLQSQAQTQNGEGTLQHVFGGDFQVGAALSERQIMGRVPEALALTEEQFNSITPENSLKWEKVHPRPDEYSFEAADKFVEFGEQHGMFVIGHTLVWHSQTPRWVFQDEDGKPLDREALLARMRDHILTVVGRYKGRIQGWDVVNEAIDVERGDDTRGKWRESNWRRIIGPDYIEKAFEFAHEADPEVELYYNDFDEWKSGKRKYLAELVESLKAKGIRIDGIGLQGHWGFEYPTATEIDLMFRDLSQLGVKLMITELDINVLPQPWDNTGADVNVRLQKRPESDPYPDGLPEDMERRLARRYAEIFRLFVKHREHLDRVTFWGVNDGQSWLNNWPVRGRTNYPLLFDRKFQPKPAYEAVAKIGGEAR